LVDILAGDQVIRSLPIAWVARAVDDFDKYLLRTWLRDGDINNLAAERVRLNDKRLHDSLMNLLCRKFKDESDVRNVQIKK
jgi:hypothetical protein